jgi:hypothetical protein
MSEHSIPLLLGLPIRMTYVNALWRGFVFGSLGKLTEVEEWIDDRYDLHVTSVWRIEQWDRVIVGFSDSFEAPTGVDSKSFQMENYPKYTHQEELLADLFGKYDSEKCFIYNQSENMKVSHASFSSIGDLSIDFGDSYRLRVFVDGSNGACWRLRPPKSMPLPHLVIDAHEKLGVPEWSNWDVSGI